MYPFLNLCRGHLESPSAQLLTALTLNWICASHTNCDITTRRRSRSRANYQSSQRKRPRPRRLAQDFITRPSLLFSLCAEWSAHDARGCSSRRDQRTESCWELLWSYAVVCDTSSMKNTYFTFISSTVRFYMFISLWGSVRKTPRYQRNCLEQAGMSVFKIIICEG